MRDEDITGVAGFWGAAALDAGGNFPHDRVVRALTSLPDVRIWAINEDSSALFALLAEEVVFTVGLRDDGTVSVRSRPLESKRLLVSLTRGESKSIEAGRTAWSTAGRSLTETNAKHAMRGSTSWALSFSIEAGASAWTSARSSHAQLLQQLGGTAAINVRSRPGTASRESMLTRRPHQTLLV